jgi:hypothetical protein
VRPHGLAGLLLQQQKYESSTSQIADAIRKKQGSKAPIRWILDERRTDNSPPLLVTTGKVI